MKTASPVTSERKNYGREFTGEVVSLKMAKTVVVEVMHIYRHPLYKKATRKTKRFLVHNSDLSLSLGDRVIIRETKPVSKRKHFIVVEKLS